jgi:hypothetical protein
MGNRDVLHISCLYVFGAVLVTVMHMTESNDPKNSNDFQGRPSQVFGEPSAPTSATAKVYSVGDVGPGGGIVFYVHPTGTFTSIGSDGGLNCKYLEAAPADLEAYVNNGGFAVGHVSVQHALGAAVAIDGRIVERLVEDNLNKHSAPDPVAREQFPAAAK